MKYIFILLMMAFGSLTQASIAEYRVGDFIEFKVSVEGSHEYTERQEITKINDVNIVMQVDFIFPNEDPENYIHETFVMDKTNFIESTETVDDCLYQGGVTSSKVILKGTSKQKTIKTCNRAYYSNAFHRKVTYVVSNDIPFYFVEIIGARQNSSDIKRVIVDYAYGVNP